MSGRVTDPRPPSALAERDLLARLGLGPGASNGEIEAAHDEILDFLAGVPSSLRGWAEVQLTEADEAYARLNGAPASASSFPAERRHDAAAPLASPPVRGGIDDDDGFLDDPDEPVVITRRERRAAQAQTAQPQARRSAAAAGAGALVIQAGTLRKGLIFGVAGILVVAMVIGVYGFAPGGLPGITGTPKPQATAGIDTAQITALMQKIAANPGDTVSLMSLANLYYGAGDYANAATWLKKILAIDPKNVDALLALGAAQYNTGDDASAELSWRQVLAIDPKNLEAHYDLGFMYFSQSPQNVAKAREEWGQVIALAPDSDIAKTVAAHLASLGGSPAPGSPAPSGSGAQAPSGSGAPAPSPAAS